MSMGMARLFWLGLVLVLAGCGRGRGRDGADDDDAVDEPLTWDQAQDAARERLDAPELDAFGICESCIQEGVGEDGFWEWSLMPEECLNLTRFECGVSQDGDYNLVRCCENELAAHECVATDLEGACVDWDR